MSKPVGEKIVGTWKLVSWTYVDEQGTRANFFGDNPEGILMYDTNGYMNAQLMRLPRRDLNTGHLFGGTDQDVATAYRTYAAYYGRYFERAPGEFVHEVEGSLFPDWSGKEEIRYAKIEGEHLILSAPPVEVDGHTLIFEVRWRRV